MGSSPPHAPRTPPFVTAHGDGCRLRLHVQPRAKVTAWAGVHGDRLKLRVVAPPAHGAANEACLRAVAERLGVARSQVELLRGARAREKDVAVGEVTPEAAAAAFGDGR